ncbi:MAG: CPBP family intramembrane metalloprotease [Muribaculaceae bacterium]|nr:CPBP family intramembrane metalloprotease [Muribaculaceae bacterium]
MKKSDLVLSLGQRLLLLFLVFIVCYVVVAALSYFLGRVLEGNPAGAVRISAVLQDVLLFILPALVTALIVTRKPAELMCLTEKPSRSLFIAMIAVFAVAIPAMDSIIYWNYHWTFPESMASFAEAARKMEDMAGDTIKLMLADTSVAALLINILIIGVFAALSEEILFRGCLLRLMLTGGVNRHVAVWTVAFIFTVMHFQLFGLVPRLLLGAYFGYLLLWSGSLWLPFAAHLLNNTLYVVMAWHQVRTAGIGAVDVEPELAPWPFIAASFVATAGLLYMMYRRRRLQS